MHKTFVSWNIENGGNILGDKIGWDSLYIFIRRMNEHFVRNESPFPICFFRRASPKIFIEGINIIVCDAWRKIKMNRMAGGIAPRPVTRTSRQFDRQYAIILKLMAQDFVKTPDSLVLRSCPADSLDPEREDRRVSLDPSRERQTESCKRVWWSRHGATGRGGEGHPRRWNREGDSTARAHS